MIWYELASHLKMPVQRCQAETTSTEFLEWQEYLDKEQNRTTPEHYYLAQIAENVFKGIAKHPEKLQLEDFLIQFKTSKQKQKKEPEQILTEEQKVAKCAASKGAWLAITKIGRKPPLQKKG